MGSLRRKGFAVACVVLFSLLLAGADGFSAAAPGVADILRRQAGEVAPELVLEPEAPLSIEVTPVPETTDDAGIKLQVNRFLIRNNVLFSTMTLSRLVAPYEGRELTLGQVREAARKITALYQEHGYFLARAYVPAQEVRDGVVEIIVLEGTLGEVLIDGNRYYTEGFIESHFVPVKYDLKSFNRGRGAINYAEVERSMLLLTDNINLDAKATFRPGKEMFDTDLYLQVEDSLPISGYFDYNNFGSRYSGRNRLGMTINFGNLTKHGDVLSLRLMTGFPAGDTLYGRAGYEAPVNCFGTRAGMSFAYMDYDIGKEFKVLGMNGRTIVYTLYANHPLIRSRARNLNLEASFERKAVKNYVFSDLLMGDDTLSVLKVGASFNNTDHSGRNYIAGYIHQGIPGFLGSLEKGDPKASRYAAGTRETGGQFTKVTLDAGRIQRLNLDGLNRLAAMFTGDDCAGYDERIGYLILRGQGQYTGDDLVVAEQFALGGPDTVRGYPMGQYNADRGFALSAELRAPILRDRFADRVQLSFFTDYGRGWLVTAIPFENKSESLSGAGLGLRVDLPWETNLRLDCAWRIGGIQPSDGHKPAVYVQLMKSF